MYQVHESIELIDILFFESKGLVRIDFWGVSERPLVDEFNLSQALERDGQGWFIFAVYFLGIKFGSFMFHERYFTIPVNTIFYHVDNLVRSDNCKVLIRAV